MLAQIRLFKNGEKWQEGVDTHERLLRHAVTAITESTGMRFTGCARWFMDGKPCRVLSFEGDAGTANCYIRFLA